MSHRVNPGFSSIPDAKCAFLPTLLGLVGKISGKAAPDTVTSTIFDPQQVPHAQAHELHGQDVEPRNDLTLGKR